MSGELQGTESHGEEEGRRAKRERRGGERKDEGDRERMRKREIP